VILKGMPLGSSGLFYTLTRLYLTALNILSKFTDKILSKKFGGLKTSLKFYRTILPDNGSKI